MITLQQVLRAWVGEQVNKKNPVRISRKAMANRLGLGSPQMIAMIIKEKRLVSVEHLDAYCININLSLGDLLKQLREVLDELQKDPKNKDPDLMAGDVGVSLPMGASRAAVRQEGAVIAIAQTAAQKRTKKKRMRAQQKESPLAHPDRPSRNRKSIPPS